VAVTDISAVNAGINYSGAQVVPPGVDLKVRMIWPNGRTRETVFGVPIGDVTKNAMGE
jgi:hypothetical protein